MTHCSQTEIPQTSYLTATTSCVLPPPVRRRADGKTSPTAGLLSSLLHLRHKAAPLASRLFSVTHGSTIRLLCLQKKSLPLMALLWDCQHERGRLSIKMTGMSGVYSEQELRISTASFFFLLLMNICRRDKTHSVSHCLLNLSFSLYYKDTQWRVLNAVT